eukprot:14864507-Heterocapsa_arctica.AAC.1
MPLALWKLPRYFPFLQGRRCGDVEACVCLSDELAAPVALRRAYAASTCLPPFGWLISVQAT